MEPLSHQSRVVHDGGPRRRVLVEAAHALRGIAGPADPGCVLLVLGALKPTAAFGRNGHEADAVAVDSWRAGAPEDCRGHGVQVAPPGGVA